MEIRHEREIEIDFTQAEAEEILKIEEKAPEQSVEVAIRQLLVDNKVIEHYEDIQIDEYLPKSDGGATAKGRILKVEKINLSK